MPPSVPGTTRWDMKAIDIHLDRIAGIESKPQEKEMTALEKWRASRGK